MGRLTAALPWIGLGAVASIALANWYPSWILLLAPVLVVGGFLVWQLGPGREFFGWHAGLALLPILGATAEPGCPTFESCSGEPRTVWPYFVASVALVAVGLFVALRLPAPGRLDERASSKEGPPPATATDARSTDGSAERNQSSVTAWWSAAT